MGKIQIKEGWMTLDSMEKLNDLLYPIYYTEVA